MVVAAERLGQRLEREGEVLDAVHQHQRAGSLVAVVVAAQADARAVERERRGGGGGTGSRHRRLLDLVEIGLDRWRVAARAARAHGSGDQRVAGEAEV